MIIRVIVGIATFFFFFNLESRQFSLPGSATIGSSPGLAEGIHAETEDAGDQVFSFQDLGDFHLLGSGSGELEWFWPPQSASSSLSARGPGRRTRSFRNSQQEEGCLHGVSQTKP